MAYHKFAYLTKEKNIVIANIIDCFPRGTSAKMARLYGVSTNRIRQRYASGKRGSSWREGNHRYLLDLLEGEEHGKDLKLLHLAGYASRIKSIADEPWHMTKAQNT